MSFFRLINKYTQQEIQAMPVSIYLSFNSGCFGSHTKKEENFMNAVRMKRTTILPEDLDGG
jgi:hypothetical protein